MLGHKPSLNIQRIAFILIAFSDHNPTKKKQDKAGEGRLLRQHQMSNLDWAQKDMLVIQHSGDRDRRLKVESGKTAQSVRVLDVQA